MDSPTMMVSSQATQNLPGDQSVPVPPPIYVDVSALEEKHLTGIGRFVALLVQALARLVPLNLLTTAAGDYIPIRDADLPDADADLPSWVRHLLRRPRKPLHAASARESAVIYTALRPPVRLFQREIGILYDFTTLLLPWTHGQQSRQHFGAFFAHTSALCDKLVAISESTKRDAKWLCAADNDAIVVGYPGPSLCVRAHACPRPVARRDNLILVVSALEPRKNVPFLLDWFATTEAVDADTELWWVGPKTWWASRDFMATLKRLEKRRVSGDKQRRIRLLGKISDHRLCELYRQATFTIYPSLYEGFGLPVLDSLLHGTPVACGYHSSLQELSGAGVFYFDPCDSLTLDEACRALLAARPVTIDTAALRERFSWDRLAQTVLALCA